MPRPKKDGRYLNLYLDRTLHEEFEQFCESLGQTKTVAAERAFRMYIEAITHGIPETLGCILDKLIMVVSGIGSIALIIFLIAQIG